MNINKKYKSEYYLSFLGCEWSREIIKEIEKNRGDVGIIEQETIVEDCCNKLFSAIQSGDLEATFPDKRIEPERRFSDGTLINEETKDRSLWIIKTLDFIEWLKANEHDYKWLTEDPLEHDYKTNSFHINSSIHDRLTKAVKDFEQILQEITERRPGNPPGQDRDIKPWLKKNGYTKNDPEILIFSRIITQHYNLKKVNLPDK